MKIVVNKTPAYLSLIIGVILIGLSPILIKLAHAPGIVTSFYRMGIGALVLLIPFLINIAQSKSVLSAKGILIAMLAGICFACDMALWTTGIVASNATLPTLTANMAPVWVGIGAMLIFREKQNLFFWIGILLTLLGVTLLLAKNIHISNNISKGVFLGLSAGVFYATYQLLAQPGRKLLDTLNFLFISSITSAIVLGIMIPINHCTFTGYDTTTWILWFAMGIGMQGFGWFLINYAQGYIPASIISPSMLMQPVITAILALSFLDEKFTHWHIIGGIIVLSGIYIVHFSRRK